MFQGLIVSSRKNSLQEFKKPWAHEHEPLADLISAVKVKILTQCVNFTDHVRIC